VPRAGQTPSPRDLKAHVARLLPRYMVPADIQIARSLPRTLNGKIDRTRVFESISSANTIKQ
jgi:acyl-CoA synthetase (AMP-forming)/AMP-acid ligase II